MMGSLPDVKVPHRQMYGTPGMNTTKNLKSQRIETVIASDGEPMRKPGFMYRMDEYWPGRRQPEYAHLHNLSSGVLARATQPPMNIEGEEPTRRKKIWDDAARAAAEALANVESGTHIAVCANSGVFDPKLEAHAPSCLIPGAKIGLLFVAEFRASTDPIHEDWYQIAVPTRPNEGRLLAGLRLIPTVLSRRDLNYTVTNLVNLSVPYEMRSFIKDHTNLPYGSISNSWVPTNLGCWFHPGGIFSSEYDIFRASFAWDGDLYSWDEATIFTRKPIALITYSKPVRRFDIWTNETAFEKVNWLQLIDGKVCGGFQEVTRRADIISWDKNRIPEGQVHAYSSKGCANERVE